MEGFHSVIKLDCKFLVCEKCGALIRSEQAELHRKWHVLLRDVERDPALNYSEG